MVEELKERIKKHEGFVPKIYRDSLGYATIGYGIWFYQQTILKMELHIQKKN